MTIKTIPQLPIEIILQCFTERLGLDLTGIMALVPTHLIYHVDGLPHAISYIKQAFTLALVSKACFKHVIRLVLAHSTHITDTKVKLWGHVNPSKAFTQGIGFASHAMWNEIDRTMKEASKKFEMLDQTSSEEGTFLARRVEAQNEVQREPDKSTRKHHGWWRLTSRRRCRNLSAFERPKVVRCATT